MRCSCWLALLLSLLAGCRSNNNELLEMALRSREQDMLILREELAHLEYQNSALQREMCALRQQGPLAVPPELAAQVFPMKRIVLGRTTGGLDNDNQYGDEALQVVIEPRDLSDHVIKAPGSAQILALEISPEGLKAPISTWQIPPEQMRLSWKQGMFTTGYVLILPWQQMPKMEQVRIVVRFALSDGRLFEADRDIRVRINPVVFRPAPPVKAGPPLAPSDPVLPAPREVEPAPEQAPPPEKVTPPEKMPAPEQAPAPEKMPPVQSPPIELYGPNLQPAGHWYAPGLEGAVKLHRPIPLSPR
jgi:hypothetical protein